MFECLAVTSAEMLRAAYPLLDEACQRLTEREGRPHFAPDVYAELLAGKGKAFVVRSFDAPVGVFVVQPTADSNGAPALQLWIGYAVPGASGAFEFGLRECERMAAAEGRQTLVFGSCRRGWLRHAPRAGFELREFIFEKRVTP